MDENTAHKLINSKTYKTAIHHVANKTRVSDEDATNLVFQALTKRLANKNWSLEAKLTSNSSELNWLITWSSKDAIRAYYKKEYRQQEIKEELKKHAADSYLINLEKPAQSLNDVEKDKIIKLLPSIFSHSSTVTFATLLLKVGKVRTEEELNITDKQFNKKLSYIEKYCNSHRKKLINLVISKQDAHMIAEENVLKQFIDLLEGRYNDVQFQELITENRIYIEDLIGTISCLDKPLLVLDNWANAPRKSQYKVVNKIYDEYSFLSRQLKEV